MADQPTTLAQLQKWAPIFVMHPDEAYFPSSVDWYLQKVRLLDAAGNPVATFEQNADTLVDSVAHERAEWTLDILDTASRTGQKDQLATVPCYGYVRPVVDLTGKQVAVDLNYVCFYPFNGNIFDQLKLAGYLLALQASTGPIFFIPVLGPILALARTALTIGQIVEFIRNADGLGMHEGDFELVTVRVSLDQSTVLQVYMSAHAEGQWTTAYAQNPGDLRPIVYVAQSSHANYPTTGTTTRVGGLANDETADSTYRWDTKTTVIDVGWNPLATESVVWTPCPLPSTPTIPNDNGLFAYWDGSSVNGPTPVFLVRDLSVAINNAGYLLCCGRASNNQILYIVRTLAFNTNTLSVALPAQANAGTGVGIPLFTGGDADTGPDSAPTIAMNNAGAFVSAVIERGMIWWNAGRLDKDHPVAYAVMWGVGLATPNVSPSGNPSMAINDNEVVLLAFKNGTSRYSYWGGTVDPTLGPNAIKWWQSELPNSDTGSSSPSIALNKDGVVISVRSTNNTLYYSRGKVDAATQSLTWFVHDVKYGSGNNPQVALDQEGVVLETHETDGTLYYHIGKLALEGTVPYVRWFNSSTNHGQGTSFGKTNDNPVVALTNSLLSAGATAGGGSSTTESATVPTIALMAATDGWQWGVVDTDNFTNWQPSNQQSWLKYSGRWGNKATTPLFALAADDMAEMTPGPRGPAYKGVWLTGPG